MPDGAGLVDAPTAEPAQSAGAVAPLDYDACQRFVRSAHQTAVIHGDRARTLDRLQQADALEIAVLRKQCGHLRRRLRKILA
jgi:hypothetical protein